MLSKPPYLLDLAVLAVASPIYVGGATVFKKTRDTSISATAMQLSPPLHILAPFGAPYSSGCTNGFLSTPLFLFYPQTFGPGGFFYSIFFTNFTIKRFYANIKP